MRSPPAGASTSPEIERGFDVRKRDDLTGQDGENTVDDLALLTLTAQRAKSREQKASDDDSPQRSALCPLPLCPAISGSSIRTPAQVKCAAPSAARALLSATIRRSSLNAQVDANRTDRANDSAGRSRPTPRICEKSMSDTSPPDVAAIDERDRAEAAAKRNARLGVQHDQPVATRRKPVLVDRLRRAEPIEREPAHGRVAAGKETLARRQVVQNDRRSPSLLTLARKARRQPDAPAEHENGRTRSRAAADR